MLIFFALCVTVLTVCLHSWGVPGGAQCSSSEAGPRIHQYQSSWRRTEGESFFISLLVSLCCVVVWIVEILKLQIVETCTIWPEFVFFFCQMFHKLDVNVSIAISGCNRCAMLKVTESSVWLTRCSDTTGGLTPSRSRTLVRPSDSCCHRILLTSVHCYKEQ